MHGLGNSYIYIDCVRENNFFLDEKKIFVLAQKLSDKNFGIGADGLILILKSNKSDFKMRIINSDGTEAEMCGNGIRCVGKFVYEKKLAFLSIIYKFITFLTLITFISFITFFAIIN